MPNNVGRPTKYTQELLSKCYKYLEAWKDEGDMIPSHEGLMLFIGISKTCMYDWAKEDGKDEFSSILDKIMVMQKRELINKGLSNDFNSNIAKLALGKHGYSDKQDTNFGGAIGMVDLSNKTDEELKAIINGKG